MLNACLYYVWVLTGIDPILSRQN